MAIEVNSSQPICHRCGTMYGRRKGYFPVCYSPIYKGVGYMSVCKKCIDDMYDSYLSGCNNAHDAVRQVCRKLDLYWNENVYQMVERKSSTKSMMTQYIAKINTMTYAGKCYDDTLSEEGTLWNFKDKDNQVDIPPSAIMPDEDDDFEVTEDMINFWGSGYSTEEYKEYEQRKANWISKYPEGSEIDIGTEILIKQICFVESDINRGRIEGKSVDKSINTLNTLLGSLNLKPTQKSNSDVDNIIENTPFGVWIKRWEDCRPIPEVEDDDIDEHSIIKYISTWFVGHLCKMLNIKNANTKLYDEEIEKMRIEHPEYDDTDDETMFNDIFGGSSSDEESDDTDTSITEEDK